LTESLRCTKADKRERREARRGRGKKRNEERHRDWQITERRKRNKEEEGEAAKVMDSHGQPYRSKEREIQNETNRQTGRERMTAQIYISLSPRGILWRYTYPFKYSIVN